MYGWFGQLAIAFLVMLIGIRDGIAGDFIINPCEHVTLLSLSTNATPELQTVDRQGNQYAVEIVMTNGGQKVFGIEFSKWNARREIVWRTLQTPPTAAPFDNFGWTPSHTGGIIFAANVRFTNFLLIRVASGGVVDLLTSYAVANETFDASPNPPRILEDPSGNIVLAGGPRPLDGLVPQRTNLFGMTKFASDGSLLWTTRGSNVPSLTPPAWNMDPDGNIVAAGTSINRGTWDSYTSKIDPNGGTVWINKQAVDPLTHPFSVLIDSHGNILVSRYTGSQIETFPRVVSTVKITKDGRTSWLASHPYGLDTLPVLAFDPVDNLYVSYFTDWYSSFFPFSYKPILVLLKYDTAGNRQWIKTNAPQSFLQSWIPDAELWPSRLDVTNGENISVSGLYLVPQRTAGSFQAEYQEDLTPGLPHVYSRSDRVPINRDFTIRATVSGTEPLYLQWFIGDKPILNATNSTFTVAAAALTNSTGSDRYYLLASNAVGCALSEAIQLFPSTIKAPTLWMPARPVKFLSPQPGQPAAFDVTLVASGDPGYSYYLETSSDLRDWESLEPFAMPYGPISLVNRAAAERQFYRLRVEW